MIGNQCANGCDAVAASVDSVKPVCDDDQDTIERKIEGGSAKVMYVCMHVHAYTYVICNTYT